MYCALLAISIDDSYRLNVQSGALIVYGMYGCIQDDFYEACPFISTNAWFDHLIYQFRFASSILSDNHDFKVDLGTLFLHDLWMQRLK